MRTHQIENAANRGDIATADFPLGLILRQNVIPAFLEDVGRVGWRDKFLTITTVPGQQAYALPRDFFEIEDVFYPGDAKALFFIGEDPIAVAAAEAQVASATANGLVGYYLAPDTTDPTRWAIKLNIVPTAAVSITVVYYWYVPFDDDEDVDLRLYVPEQYHWALVALLRREIISDRFGQGDARYVTANAEYQEWLKRISQKRELAPRGNRANYMR